MHRGIVQVYTGEGKGKTTAAVGQAIRAYGHGFKIILIQFMKGNRFCGELKTLNHLKGLAIEQYGLPTFVDKSNPSRKDIEIAKKGFKRSKEVITSGQYNMVILDEINTALYYCLIPMPEVIELLRNKPAGVDIILTGRNAPKKLIEIADLVTEMKEIKHHSRKDISSREGIEY